MSIYNSLNFKVKRFVFKFYFASVNSIYEWITIILERIDNNLNNVFSVLQEIEEEKTPIQVNEALKFNAHQLCVDFMSLVLFINLLLDSITRLLDYSITGAKGLEPSSFYRFKTTLQGLSGENIDELRSIFLDTEWYNQINDLRDKPIVYIEDKENIFNLRDEEIGIYLNYLKENEIIEMFISNNTIDEYADNAYILLDKICSFLMKNIDNIPLQV